MVAPRRKIKRRRLLLCPIGHACDIISINSYVLIYFKFKYCWFDFGKFWLYGIIINVYISLKINLVLMHNLIFYISIIGKNHYQKSKYGEINSKRNLMKLQETISYNSLVRLVTQVDAHQEMKPNPLQWLLTK